MSLPKIVVTTVSNRGYKYLQNIINNFIRQSYPHKKLIIIFNCDIDKKNIQEQLLLNDIKDCILESFPNKSLGYCLNYSVSKIPDDYNIWTKMDDDDFYDKNYLLSNLEAMLYSNSDIVGRRDMYVYVPELKRLYLKLNGGRNKRVDWVQGATLFVKKCVFQKICFPDKNKGEDTKFNELARKKGFSIYAGSIDDIVIIRHIDNNKHTWKINLTDFLRNSKVVSTNTFNGLKNHIF